MDVSQAHNIVDHKILMLKVKHHGVSNDSCMLQNIPEYLWLRTGRLHDKFQSHCINIDSSDATAEAEALTRDLFGCKRKRKQLNQTASASRYYIDYTVLSECYQYFQPVMEQRKRKRKRWLGTFLAGSGSGSSWIRLLPLPAIILTTLFFKNVVYIFK